MAAFWCRVWVYEKAGGKLLHAMPQKQFASYLRLPDSTSEQDAWERFLRHEHFRNYKTAESESVIKI